MKALTSLVILVMSAKPALLSSLRNGPMKLKILIFVGSSPHWSRVAGLGKLLAAKAPLASYTYYVIITASLAIRSGIVAAHCKTIKAQTDTMSILFIRILFNISKLILVI